MFLMEVMNEHFDALEADFEREYNGLDLLDVYRGNLPMRKAANLAANLPAGSLIWQALDHPNAWTAQEYLTANLLDAQNAANWMKAGAKPSDKPKPTPRPGEGKEKKKKSKADIRAAATRFKSKMPVIVPGPPAEDQI